MPKKHGQDGDEITVTIRLKVTVTRLLVFVALVSSGVATWYLR